MNFQPEEKIGPYTLAQNPDGSIPLSPRITGAERTPEPGALALLGGLGVMAGIFSLSQIRRRVGRRLSPTP